MPNIKEIRLINDDGTEETVEKCMVVMVKNVDPEQVEADFKFVNLDNEDIGHAIMAVYEFAKMGIDTIEDD